MAIIIPSKNTHSMQLNLIRDNSIKLIETEAYRANIPLRENQNVYGNAIGVKGVHQTDGYRDDFKSTTDTAGYHYPVYAYAEAAIQYEEFDLVIPRSGKNKYLSKIYSGTNENGSPQISISNIIGDKKQYGASLGIRFDLSQSPPSYSHATDIVYTLLSEENDIKWDYFTDEIVADISKTNFYITANANVEMIPQNAIPSKVDEYEDRFVVHIKVAVGYSITTLSGLMTTTSKQNSFFAYGEKVIYTAKTFEISVNGAYYEFDLEAVRKQVGDTNEKSYSVPSNELMQIENYYGVRSQNQLETAFIQTINNYKNGKETATIRCSISDYYDNTWAVISPTKTAYDVSGIELRNLESRIEIKEPLPFDLIVELEVSSSSKHDYITEAVIYKGLTYTDFFAADDESIVSARVLYADATPRMTFDIYDEVIPMVYGADGQDHPMSLYKDGTPKVFKVLGTKVFYDGAVWQELSLQEV